MLGLVLEKVLEKVLGLVNKKVLDLELGMVLEKVLDLGMMGLVKDLGVRSH